MIIVGANKHARTKQGKLLKKGGEDRSSALGRFRQDMCRFTSRPVHRSDQKGENDRVSISMGMSKQKTSSVSEP